MKRIVSFVVGLTLALTNCVGCSVSPSDSGKTTINLVTYKMEATDLFSEFAAAFNRENPDLNLVIEPPKDAVTIIKTRLIKENSPDMIGIGGDNNFSILVDAGVVDDISDYQGIKDVNERYLGINKELEIVPKQGVYGLPYAANASGVLYNEALFDEYGWEVPDTWDELIGLCQKMESAEIAPFTFGYKDTWTTLAPWNALAVSLTNADLFKQVNLGQTKFADHYAQIALKQKKLMAYSLNDPFAYGYNDACTAFARQEAAMYPIGSYAIPQILSVNPGLNIGSFVMPATNNVADNLLNSGIDLQFCVMEDSQHKEACYRVLEFFQRDENVQKYINNQISVPCKTGDFQLNETIADMGNHIQAGLLQDYPDHHYPSELSADALIQTYLINDDLDAFLSAFDKDLIRYNRDNIQKLKDYNESLK